MDIAALTVRLTIIIMLMVGRMVAALIVRTKRNPEPWLTSLFIIATQPTVFGVEPPRGLRGAVIVLCVACAVVALCLHLQGGPMRTVRTYQPDGTYVTARQRVKLPGMRLPRAERAAHRAATASLPARQRAAAWWSRRHQTRHAAEVAAGIPEEHRRPWRRRDEWLTAVLAPKTRTGDLPAPPKESSDSR